VLLRKLRAGTQGRSGGVVKGVTLGMNNYRKGGGGGGGGGGGIHWSHPY